MAQKDDKKVRFARLSSNTNTLPVFQKLDKNFEQNEPIEVEIRCEGTERIVAIYEGVAIAGFRQSFSKQFKKNVLLQILHENPQLKGQVVELNDKGVKMQLDYEGDYEDYAQRVSPQLSENESTEVLSENESTESISTNEESSSETSTEEIDPNELRISHQIKQMVAKGISNETTLTQIKDYLLKCGVNYSLIEGVFDTMKPYSEEVRTRIPTYPSPIYQDVDQTVLHTVAHAMYGYHFILDAPAATGKNTLVKTLAWIFQRPLYEMSLNRQTNRFDLLGDNTLTYNKVESQLQPFQAQSTLEEQTKVFFQNVTETLSNLGNKGQEVVFRKELLVEAMEEGGIFCFDEINTTTASLMSILNSTLDNRGSINVPSYGYVKADKNFLAIGTMNNGYYGTDDLNEALSSRFAHFNLNYPENITDVLVENVPYAKKSDVRTINKLYKKMRLMIDDVNQGLPSHALNVRGFIRALSLAQCIDLKTALINNVANGLKDPTERDTVIQAINLNVKS